MTTNKKAMAEIGFSQAPEVSPELARPMSIYGYPLPRTLDDVARAEESVLPLRFREWLDYFYLGDDDLRIKSMEDEPRLCNIWIWDIWFAAAAEHLSRLANLEPPEWVYKETRYLHGSDVYWGWDSPQMRAIVFVQSPSAFRLRHIFTLASCLERATTPREWLSDPWLGFEKPEASLRADANWQLD